MTHFDESRFLIKCGVVSRKERKEWRWYTRQNERYPPNPTLTLSRVISTASLNSASLMMTMIEISADETRWRRKEDSSYIYIYTLFFASLDNCFILSLLWLSFPVSLSDSIDLTLLFHLTLVFLISSSCLWYPCLIYLKYTVFASCQMPFCRETHTNGMKWKKSSIHLRHTTQPWRWSSLDIKKIQLTGKQNENERLKPVFFSFLFIMSMN